MRSTLRLRIAGLIAILPVLLVCAIGQNLPGTTSNQDTTVKPIALNQTSQEIKKSRPEIPESVLAADIEAITAAFPRIEAEYWKIGLTDEDALWASQRAWKAARLESNLRLTPNKVIDVASFISHTTDDLAPKIVRWQIRTENPKLSNLILSKDMKLIEAAQPEIIANYQKLGWSESDACNASLVVWKMARLESPLKVYETIDQRSLIEATQELGMVVFISEPDEAEVFIESKKIGTTNKERNAPSLYYPGGKDVVVRFTKPNFASQDQTCKTIAEQTVVCKAQLQPSTK